VIFNHSGFKPKSKVILEKRVRSFKMAFAVQYGGDV